MSGRTRKELGPEKEKLKKLLSDLAARNGGSLYFENGGKHITRDHETPYEV